MIIKVKNIPNLQLPKYANPNDAGADVFATSDPIIVGRKMEGTEQYRFIDYIEYETNLYIAPQDDIEIEYSQYFEPTYKRYEKSRKTTKYFIDLRPRSSISKYNLSLCNPPATIDLIFRGMIKVRFKYLFQPEDMISYASGCINGTVNYNKIYSKGDRICQMMPAIQNNIEFQLVDELDSTERGIGAFGSSDR